MSSNEHTDASPSPPGRRRWASLLGHVAVHVTGVSVVSAVLLFAVVSPEMTAVVAQRILETPSLASGMYAKVAIHLGCASVIWVFLWAIVRRLFARAGREPAKWKIQAGATMTEFLIILPVFFLMVFGLAQFALNNVTAVLARYAAYEGARTVWAWESEARAGRRGVDQAQVIERARIAVALAMTPAAPGEFMIDQGAVSDELRRVRMAMYNRFRSPSSIGVTWAMGGLDMREEAVEGNKSFVRALDSSSFSTRAARKLTHAYLATEVGSGVVNNTSDAPGLLLNPRRVGMRFVFWHQQTMPLVSGVFGEPRTVSGIGGRRGYFNPIKIEHTFPKQPHSANAGWPQR